MDERDPVKGNFQQKILICGCDQGYYDMSLPETTGIRGTPAFRASTAYRDEIEGMQQSLLFSRDKGELPIVQQTCLLPSTCRGGEK